MATRYYFQWNNIRSTDMGIIMNAAQEIIKPEERVQHVTIPGRRGELTQTEGDDIYNSYIQTVGIAVRGVNQVAAVENWLKGDGYVTFSSEPTLKQRARVIGAVTMTKHSRNLDWWEGDVQFYCEPVKRLIVEEPILLTESGETVVNPGHMASKPAILIEGSGLVTLRIGGNVLTLPDLQSGWTVDSETEWVLDGQAPLTGVCRGDFPVIPVGESAIQWTGDVTQVTITPRWRFL